MTERRVAPTGTVYSIQILRAVAALLVVCRHAAKELSSNPEAAFVIGQAGVDIFFVISGFVIYFTSRNFEPRDFIIKRITRVVPLYWLVLIAVVATRIANGHSNDPYFLTNSILSFLFIPSHINPDLIFPPIVVGWTLNFEAYFYAIFAIGLCFAKRLNPIWFATGAIVVGIVAGIGGVSLLNPDIFPPALLLLPISLEFVGGMWLAKMWVERPRRGSWAVASLLIVGAIIWFAVAPGSQAYTIARPIYWGVPAVAIVAAALQLEAKVDFSRYRLPLLLGNASYSLYLVHLLVFPVVLKVTHKVVPGLPRPILFVALIVAATVVGIVVHKMIELPLARAFKMARQRRVSPKRGSLQAAEN